MLQLAGGCTDNGVGRKCILESQPDGGFMSTQITSPALECQSRLCLIQAPQGSNPPRSTCSVQCASDADCAQATLGPDADGLCSEGFVCATVTVTGAFKCKTMCVCKADLACGLNKDTQGNVVVPQACGGPGASGCP
jgi:hypothetical protein